VAGVVDVCAMPAVCTVSVLMLDVVRVLVVMRRGAVRGVIHRLPLQRARLGVVVRVRVLPVLMGRGVMSVSVVRLVVCRWLACWGRVMTVVLVMLVPGFRMVAHSCLSCAVR